MNGPDVGAHEPKLQDSTPIERLLVVADAAVAEVDELPPRVRAVIDAVAQVYVVTPSLPGRLAWLASELNESRHAADERLNTVLGHMRSIGVRASGMSGDNSTLAAFRRRREVPARSHPDRAAQPRPRLLARAGG